jgi:putative membrane protein insertion efficiency factor
MQRLLSALITCYQWCLSPWLGHHCRFYPTCSHYAQEAIQQHGSLRGCVMACRRLLKCHPWHPGGVDLVPRAPTKESN